MFEAVFIGTADSEIGEFPLKVNTSKWKFLKIFFVYLYKILFHYFKKVLSRDRDIFLALTS